jgi:hypothetical protein
MDDRWIINVWQGFAVGGEVLELLDENNELMNVENLSAKMRITGFNRDEEFSTGTGNFAVVPPVAPATFPTAWEFKLSVQEVNELKNGNNEFTLLIADENAVLVGEMYGTIVKRNK